jgi:hypothetical protein
MAYNSVSDYKVDFNIFAQHLYMLKANIENFLTNTKKFPRHSTKKADPTKSIKTGSETLSF